MLLNTVDTRSLENSLGISMLLNTVDTRSLENS
jgi:hypothetical protein